MSKGKSGADLSQQINFLKKIPFFNDFDDHEVSQFLAVSKWLKVDRGTMIIRENTVEKVFYILVKGEVAVTKTAATGEAVELTRLATGDCFGEMALLGEIRRTAGVRAASDCFILRVEPEIINRSNVFLQLKFYKRFCEIMVDRLDQANRRMAGTQPPLAEEEEKKAPTPKTPPAHDLDAEPAGETETSATEPEPEPEPEEPAPPLPERKERISRSRIQKRIFPDYPLPVNPMVARNIAPFLSGQSINTRSFTDFIYLDPVLSFKVLKVANSSLYRRSREIITVPHAIISVGITVIQEVVAKAVDDGSGIEPFGSNPQMAKKYWRHCVLVGRIADLLKQVIRINIAADVYLAGLLHDLGMLVLDPMEPAFYPNIEKPSSQLKNLVAAETEHIGVDHGQAGQWLAEKCGLSSSYQDVMRHHHNPLAARENVLLVSLVSLANCFAAAREECLGAATLRENNPANCPGWMLLKREHPPFAEVNVVDFNRMIEAEIEKAWPEMDPGF